MKSGVCNVSAAFIGSRVERSRLQPEEGDKWRVRLLILLSESFY